MSSPAPWGGREQPARRWFSRQAPDLIWGIARCLAFLGALPEKLVWDREGALHAGGGRPSEELAAFCGALPVGSLLRAPRPAGQGDRRAPPGLPGDQLRARPPLRGPEHYQQELDAWERRVAGRQLRTLRARPTERLAEERKRMRRLPAQMPDVDRRLVLRVPPQPYLHWDRNDYSLDPRFAGRRVEVRIGQGQISAVALGSGELVASHRRSFAKGLTFTDPPTRAARPAARRAPPWAVEVELRPLARYDALIPA